MADKFVVNFDAFRFYEDGTESGSTQIAAENTNVTGRDVDSDSQIHLRVRIQETGGGSVPGASTDDYQLQWRLNGGGQFTAVTSSSSTVQSDTASLLTDGDPTTNRSTDGITDGAGSFFAGIQKENDSELVDFQQEADNFTEHVFALLLISADLSNTDFVEFRFTLNGGNPGMTNDATPQITVTKAGAGAFPYHAVNEQRKAIQIMMTR